MKLIGPRTELNKRGPATTPVWVRACDHLIYSKQGIINYVRESGINYYDAAADIRDAAKSRIGEEE